MGFETPEVFKEEVVDVVAAAPTSPLMGFETIDRLNGSVVLGTLAAAPTSPLMGFETYDAP